MYTSIRSRNDQQWHTCYPLTIIKITQSLASVMAFKIYLALLLNYYTQQNQLTRKSVWSKPLATSVFSYWPSLISSNHSPTLRIRPGSERKISLLNCFSKYNHMQRSDYEINLLLFFFHFATKFNSNDLWISSVVNSTNLTQYFVCMLTFLKYIHPYTCI